jgi:hypothetical protein
MKAIESPLKIEEIRCLRFEYSFIQSKEAVNWQELSNAWNIDIDFIHQDRGNDKFWVFAKVEINRGENVMPGYMIFAECITSFSLKRDGLSEEEYKNLYLTSATSIAVQNLRSVIFDFTKLAPIGKYIIPAIDVSTLINQKYFSKGTSIKKESTPPKKVDHSLKKKRLLKK